MGYRPDELEPPVPAFSGLRGRPLSDGSHLEIEYAGGKPNGYVRVCHSLSEGPAIPRMTIRRWMVAIAIAGIVMGWVVHARGLLLRDDEFGAATVFLECFLGVFVVLPIGLVIGFFVRHVRGEARYRAQLRRNATPALCPRFSVEPDPGDPR